MPVDKHGNGTTAKPFTPTLSSHFRSAKSPLTPRLVGSVNSSPALSPRRDGPVRTIPAGKDEPLASPLNGNITPRSGARNSRIGTESPSTPGASNTARVRAASINSADKRSAPQGHGSGLGITSPGLRSAASAGPKTLVGNAPKSSPNASGRPLTMAPRDREDDLPPHFFRADAARHMGEPAKAPDRPKLGHQGLSFYSAPGSSTGRPEPARAATLSSSKEDEQKFFHADEISQQSGTRPALGKKNSSASATSPRLQSTDLTRRSKSRPPSPLKQQPTSPRTSPPNRVALNSNQNTHALDRRKSIGSNVSTGRQTTHRKSASTSSSVLNQTPSRNPGLPPSTVSPPYLNIGSRVSDRSLTAPTAMISFSPDNLSPRSTSLASSNTLATSDTDHSGPIRPLQTPTEMKSPSPFIPQSYFPTSAPPPSLQVQPQSQPQPPPVSELTAAAAARRERKVLDLEISNSSLLAINKTLERSLRKQSAELRRFRRLSRSGRLSLAVTLASNRTASGASGLSTLAEDAEGTGEEDDEDDVAIDDLALGLDSMNLDYSENSDSDLDSSLSSSNTNSSNPLSPSARTLRQRARDEKRLLMDLNKHQQLLLDSQKLSQSIRRCVGWTEEMVREGERALAYKVGVGDIKLGGRVLHGDVSEDEHDDSEAHDVEDLGRARVGDSDGDSFRKATEMTDHTQSAVNLRRAMGDAMMWTGPGAMQALEGTKNSGQKPSLQSPLLSPNR